jgi:hypothetical protein
MSEVQDLRQHRTMLETQLGALRDQRDRASRANSFALSRQRVGVTDHDESKMKELAGDEVAGDSVIIELRRQIESIDIELRGSSGVSGTGRRALKWLRR